MPPPTTGSTDIGFDFTGSIPYGAPSTYSLYIRTKDAIPLNEREYTDKLFAHRIKKQKNRMSDAYFKIADVTTDDKDNYVKEGNIFLFFSENRLILKGVIGSVNVNSDSIAVIEGFGMESKFLENFTDRTEVQFTNTRADYVVQACVSGLMNVSFPDTSYPRISFRAENENRLRAISAVANEMGFDWIVSQGDNPYTEDILTFRESIGNSNVFTFNISGASQNLEVSNREDNTEDMANDITCLGYGDGLNQLRSQNFHATTTRSTLNMAAGTLSTTATTITLADASGFPASGTIWIGAEKVTYSSKSGNDLTITGTAGTNGRWSTGSLLANTTNQNEWYIHTNGIEVYDAQYTQTAPQSGSSIATYGLKQLAVTDRTIIDRDALDRLAQNINSDKRTPILRITAKTVETFSVLNNVSLGDTVTVNDSEADLTTTYTVMGIETFLGESGEEGVMLELSNIPFTFAEDVGETVKKNVGRLDVYMQGQTVIDTVSLSGVLTLNPASPTSNPNTDTLDLFFPIPSQAIAVNSVKLSYRSMQSITAVSAGASERADAADAAPGGNVTGLTADGSTWNNIKTFTVASVNTGPAVLTYHFTAIDGGGWDGGTNAYVSVLVGSNRYPSMSTAGQKIRLISGDVNAITSDVQTVVGFSGAIMIPENLNAATVQLQLKLDSGLPTTWTYGAAYVAEALHSHSLSADSFPSNSPVLEIYTTDNAASSNPTWTSRATSIALTNGGVDTDRDLTAYFTGTGWKGVRLVATNSPTAAGKLKIDAYITSQVFIKSV